ncbi:MAG TPA: hypothetical protein VHK06_01055 [Candidatus Limnocylindria bacterium]|nr:hypothetical protein [Candidatus Limnocylindria bacterium]
MDRFRRSPTAPVPDCPLIISPLLLVNVDRSAYRCDGGRKPMRRGFELLAIEPLVGGHGSRADDGDPVPELALIDLGVAGGTRERAPVDASRMPASRGSPGCATPPTTMSDRLKEFTTVASMAPTTLPLAG